MSPSRPGLFPIASACALAAAVASGTAWGQAEAEIREARELFVRAEMDEDADRWGEALDKLRQVSRVRLTAGVRFHIALCEEHLGKLAAALADYTLAENQARDEKAQDVQRLVGKQTAALAPRVPRLTVHLVPDISDAVVLLDGAPLGREKIGVALPVDPGEHRLETSAPNRPSSLTAITLREQDDVAVDLKLSEPAPPALPSTSPAFALRPADARPTAPNRMAPIIATTGAVVLAGAGVGAFLIADRQHTSAVSACAQLASASGGACNSLRNGVRAWDWAAAVAWLGTGASATAAIVLWAKPHSNDAATGAQLLVGPASIAVQGSF
jgi:hypothetical protein